MKWKGKPVKKKAGGRTPHGVRGLKFRDLANGESLSGRTPHGVRGLKCERGKAQRVGGKVAPHTGCVD